MALRKPPGKSVAGRVPPAPTALRVPDQPQPSLAAQVAALLAAGVEVLRANAAGALDARVRRDPEFVHEARVAVRRMRAPLRIFERQLARVAPAGDLRAVRRALRQLARALGAARDWDVVQSTLLPLRREELEQALGRAQMQRVARRAQLARARANTALRRFLGGAEFARSLAQVEALAAALAGGGAEGGTWPRSRNAQVAMLRALERQRRLVLSQGKRLAQLDADERHALRIEGKRLRYAVELCAPLLAGGGIKPWLRPLRGLQDVLGKLNDARMLVELAGPLGEDRALARVLAARAAECARDELPQAAATFMAWQLAGVPWKR